MRDNRTCRTCLFLLLLAALSGLGVVGTAAPVRAETNASAQRTDRPYLLHLNGIGGRASIDRMLTQGIVQGGLDADVEIHDWCGSEAGLVALAKVQRHREQSELVAKKIAELVRAQPGRRFILTCHSGGAGIAVWALEKLPADVTIDTLLMIQPALSPGYDLSKALSRVSGKAYSFNSIHDTIVLGAGTRVFGTIDRVKSDAAGRVGFQVPETADVGQYRKFANIAYDTAWLRVGNAGDHIGAMLRPFARTVISPLLQTGQLPVLPPLPGAARAAHSESPTTAPASTEVSRP